MSHYNKLWKLMTKRNFALDPETTDPIICTLCKNILNNAHSGPCECLFCKACIEQYLESGETFCPGGMDRCKAERLIMEENVTRNDKINKTVSKCGVRCTSYECDYKCELMKMCQHVSTCDKKEVRCPFKDMGCSFKTQRRKIAEHLATDIHYHNKLLTKWMSEKELNRKAEMEKEFKDMKMLIEENVYVVSNCYVQEIKKQREEIGSLVKDITEVKNKNLELSSAVTSLENNISAQNKEILDLKKLIHKKTEIFKTSSLKERTISDLSRSKGSKRNKTNSTTPVEKKSEHLPESEKNGSHKPCKTTTIKSTDSLIHRRKSEHIFSDLVNSFN